MKKVKAENMRNINAGGFYWCSKCRKSFYALGAFGVGCHAINQHNGSSKGYYVKKLF